MNSAKGFFFLSSIGIAVSMLCIHTYNSDIGYAILSGSIYFLCNGFYETIKEFSNKENKDV